MNVSNVESLSDSTVRGTLTIVGGDDGEPLNLNNLQVDGALDLSAYEGEVTMENVTSDEVII